MKRKILVFMALVLVVLLTGCETAKQRAEIERIQAEGRSAAAQTQAQANLVTAQGQADAARTQAAADAEARRQLAEAEAEAAITDAEARRLEAEAQVADAMAEANQTEAVLIQAQGDFGIKTAIAEQIEGMSKFNESATKTLRIMTVAVAAIALMVTVGIALMLWTARRQNASASEREPVIYYVLQAPPGENQALEMEHGTQIMMPASLRPIERSESRRRW